METVLLRKGPDFENYTGCFKTNAPSTSSCTEYSENIKKFKKKSQLQLKVTAC
jgi:hypothetical protein